MTSIVARCMGYAPELICDGCTVAGDGAHNCRRELIRVDGTGQAVVTHCKCEVDKRCGSWRPLDADHYAGQS